MNECRSGCRLAVVLNPRAGRGAAGRALPRIRRGLSSATNSSCSVTYYLTRERGDGEALATRAIEAGADMVIAAGGDGTLHEVVNALLEQRSTQPLLGLIPFGTGNDFARAVGLRTSLDTVLATLIDGVPHTIDIGRIDGAGLGRPRYFLVAAGIGFVADTACTVNAGIRGLSGPAAYVCGAITTLRRFEPVEISFSVDDGPRQTVCATLLSVSNVATTGGGIRIAPDAVPYDGAFDICLVARMSKVNLLRKLPAAFAGTHVHDESVTMLRARTVDVTTLQPCRLWIDGEVTGTTPARFELLPGALTMMLPKTYTPGRAQ